jgi:hypothetical protein
MLPTQLPNNATSFGIDLENGSVVTGRNQIVSVGCFVDTVDVKVVPGVGAAATGKFETFR